MTSPAFNNSQLGNTIRTDNPSFFVGASGIIFTDGSQQLTAFTGTAVVTENDPIFTGSVAYNITAIDTGNWTTAYNWGNHANIGYVTIVELVDVSGYLQNQIDNIPEDTNTFISGIIYNDNSRKIILLRNDNIALTGDLSSVLQSGDPISLLNNDLAYITGFIETDPIFVASVAYNISATQTGEWSLAYGWGDHTLVGYATESGLVAVSGYLQNQIDNINDIYVTGIAFNSGNGNLTLYLNNATNLSDNFDGRYLQSFTETDPTVSGHIKNISSTQINQWDQSYTTLATESGNWNTAYGWGDHAVVGYLQSGDNITLLNNDAGYLTSADVSGLTGNGTTNYVSKWSSSNGLTDSIIYDNGSNVGIGTASSSQFNSSFNRLVIGGGSTYQGATIYSTTQGTLAFGDTATNGVDGYRGYLAYIHNTDYMVLGTSGAERVRINNVGNVGIGTTSPSQKLDIRYPASGGMALIKDSDSDDGLLLGDMAFSASNVYQGIKHAAMTSITDYMIISEGVNTLISSTSAGSIYLRGGSNGTTNEIRVYPDTGGVVINEQGANSDFRVEGDTDANLLFTDASTDRVGIGTSSPSQQFDVSTSQLEIAGFNKYPSIGPIGSGDLQSLIIEEKNDSIITKHMENTAIGSSTLVLKNLIRYGKDFISIDDAYTGVLSTTYYPRLKVNTNTGAVTINESYTFPTADGSSGQGLITDGSGDLSWQNVIVSDTGVASGSDVVNNIISLTQAEYDAITPQSGTLYTIYGSSEAISTAKAWVNFNGTGTVSIRDSFNVSSITDVNVGIYTINFTNSMADTDYAAAGICSSTAQMGIIWDGGAGYVRTASAYQFGTLYVSNLAGAGVAFDTSIVQVIIFR